LILRENIDNGPGPKGHRRPRVGPSLREVRLSVKFFYQPVNSRFPQGIKPDRLQIPVSQPDQVIYQ